MDVALREGTKKDTRPTGKALVHLRKLDQAVEHGEDVSGGAVALVSAVEAALAEAKTPEEIIEVRDRAGALESYLETRLQYLEEAIRIAVMMVRAERLLGQWLTENVVKGSPKKGIPSDLKEHRITPKVSALYQRLACIPEKEFEDILSKRVRECQESGWVSGRDFTAATVVRLYRLSQPDPKPIPRKNKSAKSSASKAQVQPQSVKPGVPQKVKLVTTPADTKTQNRIYLQKRISFEEFTKHFPEAVSDVEDISGQIIAVSVER